MAFESSSKHARAAISTTLVLLGIGLIAFGWIIPSRFKSIPETILKEAGSRSDSLASLAGDSIADERVGVARLLLDASEMAGLIRDETMDRRIESWEERFPVIARWGAWDPFLEAALNDIALEQYSSQPGALGVALAQPGRGELRGLLENSRDPLVKDLLETGELGTYKRLFPTQSVSGRPLEATLLTLGLLAQGDRLHESFRRELRGRVSEALASGDVAGIEDFYLDALSLARQLNWGQYEALLSRFQSLDTARRLRYAFHRRPDAKPLVYASSMLVDQPSSVVDYLGLFGDDGIAALQVAAGYGENAIRMLVREKLPLERAKGSLEASSIYSSLIGFSLQSPKLSLTMKYIAFFVGAFLCFLGLSGFNSRYRERNPFLLAGAQRMFVSLASVIVLVILSEPYLSGSGEAKGYSFRFVMPILAQVDGETVIVETEPTTSMEPATLLSVSFFFALQALVFIICLLKVRQIDREKLDSLVKLKLMENEENLFDSGLYVGIAGTCISLVMQVLGLIEANLLAAYSSNLFGILCVAIVKIRLVRPYKNKLILDSQEQLAVLAGKGGGFA